MFSFISCKPADFGIKLQASFSIHKTPGMNILCDRLKTDKMLKNTHGFVKLFNRIITDLEIIQIDAKYMI